MRKSSMQLYLHGLDAFEEGKVVIVDELTDFQGCGLSDEQYLLWQ
jgi:hypothetical protein